MKPFVGVQTGSLDRDDGTKVQVWSGGQLYWAPLQPCLAVVGEAAGAQLAEQRTPLSADHSADHGGAACFTLACHPTARKS